MTTVGILHPGHMGAALAAAMATTGTKVLWASEGRSAATHQRAADQGIEDVGGLQALARASDVILSICPPDAAEEVATVVADTGFEGVFVDGNAVSPTQVRRVAAIAASGGATVVDGSVIGPPPVKSGTTRLYLSGGPAADVAALFEGSLCDARVLGEGVGRASALKMAFAAWTKGSWALQAACLALAEDHGLRPELEAEWDTWWPGRMADIESNLRMCAPKAWRFVGEMHLIAETFAESGLPPEFHEGAATVWDRWAHHRGEEGRTPSVADMVTELPRKA